MSVHRDHSARVEQQCAELAVYWPAFAAALPRDSGAGDGAQVTTSGAVLAAPVNMDVLRAVTTLRDEVAATAGWARSRVAERGRLYASDVPDYLPHMPRWYARMMAISMPRDADRLAVQVDRWYRLGKRAVGLLTPDRQLGEHCPLHDQPLVELVAPGAEGWLDDDRDRLTVAWHQAHVVECRHCGASWSPARYLWLRRLLRDAATRRRATASTQLEKA